MKWFENRAMYFNLKNEEGLNALSEEDYKKLWLPKVIYENTDQKDTTRLGYGFEWDTRVFIKKEGNSTPSGLETVDETEIFTGSENSLVMSQTYTRTFQCQFELSNYPFDTQVL